MTDIISRLQDLSFLGIIASLVDTIYTGSPLPVILAVPAGFIAIMALACLKPTKGNNQK